MGSEVVILSHLYFSLRQMIDRDVLNCNNDNTSIHITPTQCQKGLLVQYVCSLGDKGKGGESSNKRKWGSELVPPPGVPLFFEHLIVCQIYSCQGSVHYCQEKEGPKYNIKINQFLWFCFGR